MKDFSLQFCLDRAEMRGHDAAHDVEGMVRLDGNAVVINFVMRYATVGGAQVDDSGNTTDDDPERLAQTLDRDVAAETQTVHIPLVDIEVMRMWGGVVRSPRLVMHTKQDGTLEGLPWSDGRSCMMRMRRADGQRLREWLVEAELRLARAHTGRNIGI